MTYRLALVAGERPDPIAHTFTGADHGQPVDLSGWIGKATWEHLGTGATGEINGSVDGPSGTVTVALSDTALATPGVLEVVVWAGNGTLRYSSPRYRLSLSDPPGTAPSV